MAFEDTINTRELWVADKFSFMPAVTPTAAQTGWSHTNKTGTQRSPNLDTTAEVGDALGQLIDDLIAKGIISA